MHFEVSCNNASEMEIELINFHQETLFQICQDHLIIDCQYDNNDFKIYFKSFILINTFLKVVLLT